MARTKGSKNKLTLAVKDAVERAFEKVGGEEYLVWLSREHPQSFVTLISKCIPQQAVLSVEHSVDLGAAMLLAHQRLDQLNEKKVIDITPETEKVNVIKAI
tara:strand:- start:55 stop:357 length:303 start_codon:yes stop_codon:yes gene_type:complete